MRGQWQFNDLLMEPGNLRLRRAHPRDQAFLLQLFHSSRLHLSQIPMPAEFVAALVRQQYDLQRTSYGKQFPDYLNLLIFLNQEPIGNLKLYKNEADECLRLLDIALLPAHQGRGYGSTLLRELQNRVAQNDWAFRLSVDRQNRRAKKLYSELGFRLENTSATHEEMIWTSAAYVG